MIHNRTCNASHHQATVDYDRDCPACMNEAALDQGKPTSLTGVMTAPENVNLDPETDPL